MATGLGNTLQKEPDKQEGQRPWWFPGEENTYGADQLSNWEFLKEYSQR